MEGILIQVLEPHLNKQGAQFGEDIDQFFQYVPEEEPSMSELRDRVDGVMGAFGEVEELLRKIKDKMD